MRSCVEQEAYSRLADTTFRLFDWRAIEKDLDAPRSVRPIRPVLEEATERNQT